MTGSIEITEAGAGDDAAWDAFVEAQEHGNFFQLSGWSRLIKSVYGDDRVNLVARQGGQIVGVLPMTDVKSPVFGRSLISTAFTIGGGVLGSSQDVVQALGKAAVEAGRSRGVKYVELRGERPAFEGWSTKDTVYASFRKRLPDDSEAMLLALKKGRRKDVRRGIRREDEGHLRVEVGHDLDTFHRLYAHAVRDLGTPVFSKKFAAAILAEFGDRVDISIVYQDAVAQTALMTFYFRDRTMPYYIGSEQSAYGCNAVELIYWSSMRRGQARGCPVYDFGRSKYGSGPFAYKQFWGFEAKPLAYQYALVKADAVPNVNPNNPKFAMFSNLWRRMPLPLATTLGPLLARNLA